MTNIMNRWTPKTPMQACGKYSTCCLVIKQEILSKTMLLLSELKVLLGNKSCRKSASVDSRSHTGLEYIYKKRNKNDSTCRNEHSTYEETSILCYNVPTL